MRVLSLGWGVQSTTLAVMAALGDLEPIDCAIHADTLHESKLTYEYASKWMRWFVDHNVNIVTVRNESNDIITNRVGGKIFIPAFTATPNKKDGQLRRQCTGRWKIAPMRRWLQANRNGERTEMLLGISLDEFQRMQESDVKYITNCYPLIDMRMTRNDCIKYLMAHNFEVPPKSSCTFCPYHSTAEWRRTKAVEEDWLEATETDARIRKVRPPYDLFVHPSRQPLRDVDLRTQEEKGQIRLWDNECSGICGV